jgi:hypothetical protein
MGRLLFRYISLWACGLATDFFRRPLPFAALLVRRHRLSPGIVDP